MKRLLGALAATLLSCSSVQSLSHGDYAGAVMNAANDPAATGLVQDLQKCEKIAALDITFDEERTIGGTVALNWVQLGGGLLDVDSRAIATQDFLFVDPHRCRGKFNLCNRIVGREEQNAPAGPGRCQSIGNHRRMRYCDQHRVRSPAASTGPYLFH